MRTNILATAAALSDQDLLLRLNALAAGERLASVELVAHLAALDSRPALYAAKGYGSLFTYCTQALRLSEDATCNRIAAARACRRFPAILDLLASGAMSLTSVRLLGKHLTPENHEAVLERARGRSRDEIEVLVAELASRPDVPATIRKLPSCTAPPAAPAVPETAAPARSVPSGLDLTPTPSPATLRAHSSSDRPAHGSRALPGPVHHRRRPTRSSGVFRPSSAARSPTAIRV